MLKNNLTGTIFNIQKFSIHDGNGIRTLVFMKGCPLECAWCSNPESQRYVREIMFVKSNCIGCGKCSEKCPNGATDSTSWEIDRTRCSLCGECTKYCYANAKKIVGREYTVHDVIEEIEKDRVFYLNSQGGITVGGGEPTAQPEFVSALLKESKRLNLHTAIETCGYGQYDHVGMVFETADQIFFDLKHMDADTHKKLTGVDNTLIIENARRISDTDKQIVFRLPLIPSLNDDVSNVKATGEFVKSMMNNQNDLSIELLPYHALGADKYRWLDQKYGLTGLKSPDIKSVNELNDMLDDIGCIVVRS